jgi:hypothetical protein
MSAYAQSTIARLVLSEVHLSFNRALLQIMCANMHADVYTGCMPDGRFAFAALSGSQYRPTVACARLNAGSADGLVKPTVSLEAAEAATPAG